MKCDELTPIDLECNMGKDSVTGLVNREPWKAYDIDEVDAAIAELKADIADLRDDKKSTDAILDERNAEVAKLQAIIEERDKTIEGLQADYKEACDRLQTANLIKDEQMAKVTEQNETIHDLRCANEDLRRRVYAANCDARRTRY